MSRAEADTGDFDPRQTTRTPLTESPVTTTTTLNPLSMTARATSRYLFLLSIALAGPALAANTNMNCSHEENLDGKARRGVDLQLTLDEQGGIRKLGTSSYFRSGELGGSFLCTLGLPAPDIKVKFERTAGATAIFVNDRDLGNSELRLVKTNYGYRVEFTNPSARLCGAQAQFPQSIEIMPNNRECKVIWRPGYPPGR